MQLKLHKPTMAIGYSLRMCARRDDATNPGPSNLVFRSKPIPETEMSNRLCHKITYPPYYLVLPDKLFLSKVIPHWIKIHRLIVQLRMRIPVIDKAIPRTNKKQRK